MKYLLKQVPWEMGTQVVTTLDSYGNKDTYKDCGMKGF